MRGEEIVVPSLSDQRSEALAKKSVMVGMRERRRFLLPGSLVLRRMLEEPRYWLMIGARGRDSFAVYGGGGDGDCGVVGVGVAIASGWLLLVG